VKILHHSLQKHMHSLYSNTAASTSNLLLLTNRVDRKCEALWPQSNADLTSWKSLYTNLGAHLKYGDLSYCAKDNKL
jgi:hypothetical protein